MHAADQEPGYDPTDDIIAALDADKPEPEAIDPPKFLLELFINDVISNDERDAGEIILSCVAASRGANSYRWRDTIGGWADIEAKPHQASARLKDWLGSIATDMRRRAVVQALVAREPSRPIGHQFKAGIEDLVARFWGRRVVAASTNSRGHKLPKIKLLGENDATPERLRHANDNDVTADGARRVKEGFLRLFNKGKLDPDPLMNQLLYAAALRYQSDHHIAGMNPLGAMNYDRPVVDGGSGGGNGNSDHHRDRFRRAQASMGKTFGPVVDAVVINGETLRSTGLRVTHYQHANLAGAVAGERLATGLRMLAAHYKMLVLARTG